MVTFAITLAAMWFYGFRGHKRVANLDSLGLEAKIENPLFATVVVVWFIGTVVAMSMREYIGVQLGFISMTGAISLVLVLALLVRLQSAGPAFFNRPRVGRHGKQFIMYKLRTMAWRPEADLDLTVDSSDPRITGLGRRLRRWSLDELPQLWNVVRGDMALVGPRPEIPAVVATYAPWQHEALEILPGLTRLSQVSGRDTLSLTDKSRLDIFYRRHHTLALDVKILLKTLWVVVSGEGVN